MFLFFVAKYRPAVDLNDLDGIQELVHQANTLVGVLGRFHSHLRIQSADRRLNRQHEGQKEHAIERVVAQVFPKPEDRVTKE